MRNFRKLLRENGVKPKERITMITAQEYQQMKYRKRIFIEAEIESIVNFVPKTKYEASEYNKYLKVRKKLATLELNMMMLFQNKINVIMTTAQELSKLHYMKPRDRKNIWEYSKKDKNRERKILEFILENSGLDYDETIHKITFNLLPKEFQNNILLLDENSKTEIEFLNQEEILYSLIKDKTELSKKDIKNLTEIIFNSLPWYLEQISNDKKHLYQILFSSYFSSYPIIEIAKVIAKKWNIDFESEQELKKKIIEIPNLKKEIKWAVKESLENGLFISEYIPMCNSTDTETYYGDTDHKHNKIIEKWIETKQKVKKNIEEKIKNKELTVSVKTERYKNWIKKTKIFNGYDLYYSDLNLEFIKNYKEQVELYFSAVGPYFDIKKENFQTVYYNLRKFDEIIKIMSQIFETNVYSNSKNHKETLKKGSEYLNQTFTFLTDEIQEYVYLKKEWIFKIHTFFKPILELDENKYRINRDIKDFIELAERQLDDEWKDKWKE